MQSSPFVNLPDVILSTADYNGGVAGTDRVPYLNYKAGTPIIGWVHPQQQAQAPPLSLLLLTGVCGVCVWCVWCCVSPPEYTGLESLMSTYQSVSPGGREVVMELGQSTYVGNVSGFVGSNLDLYTSKYTFDANLTLGLEVMNEFLLNNKVRVCVLSRFAACARASGGSHPPHWALCSQSKYAQSKYGAYVFDGSVMAPQPNDILAYVELQNTTSAHAVPIFMNVSAARVCGCMSLSTSACVCVCVSLSLVLWTRVCS